MKKEKIGFIGQGWIGSNYSDDFEERDYEVVRYSKKKFVHNKDLIGTCDIVFIAVPTPTTPDGFDSSILEEVIGITKENQIVVIKSTIKPGTTEKIQEMYPDRKILFSPEFLTEANAKNNVKYPDRNIVGYTDGHEEEANRVMSVLPNAPYNKVMKAKEAELVKYFGNIFLMFKVIVANIFYDTANSLGVDYEVVKEATLNDNRIGKTHFEIFHDGGRGAGGDCFIKDFEAFREFAKSDYCSAIKILDEVSSYNRDLLDESGKSKELVKNVFGS